MALAVLQSSMCAGQGRATVRPQRGLVVTRSARVAPGTYRLTAPSSADSALIVVRGDDVTVDFAGARLIGSEGAPDEGRGVAILVDGGRNITIRHARIAGYKIAIRSRGTRNLRVLDSDLSDNWRPRLFSLVEHESLVDWLSFHHNDHGEWLRFGAAMYLEDVRGGEVRNTVVERGMNALLLVRTDSLLVWNDDFSFNSGLGVGLYRSSDNRIMHNRLDYDVRGHSEGFYHRGQDSAGILVYEQSCRNVIAFNSVTHGGDGLFLWAGQSTMDTGEGGANDNLVFANDFSYSPANGIEATFSRNLFVRNRVAGSDYGVWGGYSFESRFVANDLSANRVGIAIEHGQANRIERNVIMGSSIGVRLWADSIEPSDWGYPKRRDTRSRDDTLIDNAFIHDRVAVSAANSNVLTMSGNQFVETDTEVVATRTAVARRDSVATRQPVGLLQVIPAELRPRLPKPLPNAKPTSSAVAALPRSAIIVDEWGPYDWRKPKLWPMDSTQATPLRIAVLGPPGRWVLRSAEGVASVSKRSGRIVALGVPDTIAVTRREDPSAIWRISLEFRADTGRVSQPFAYERFEPRMLWTERVFRWDENTDPRTHGESFASLLRGAPLVERTEPRLDIMWYRPPIAAIPAARWAMDATADVALPAGEYTLRAISDDAIRVWVDDTLVIDDWRPHESVVDDAPLGGGRHRLRVQYVQVDGWAELRVEILRGAATGSRGTPGPH